MSTRSIIARATGEGTFEGRYVHADGMPSSMGAELWKQLHGHFRNDLAAMLRYLIDAKHAQCGWSALCHKNFSLKPGYTWQKAIEVSSKYEVYSKLDDYNRPQCFAGRKGETPWLMTEKDLEGTDCEWLYVFSEENNTLAIRDLNHKEDVAVIDLAGLEPKWYAIECGENFERCSHYAWVHDLTPKTCNLSTQKFLERKPLDMRDAVAVMKAGKVLKLTGSGHSTPAGEWVASAKYGNGRYVELPIGIRKSGEEYVPVPGISWCFPATATKGESVMRGEVR